MTELQAGAFVLSLVLILGIGAAAEFGWLGEGRGKTTMVFLATAAAMASLAAGGLPPSWFAGSGTGFTLAVSFLIGAFVGRPAGRSFRRPFFLGLGVVLLSVNIVQAVRNVL